MLCQRNQLTRKLAPSNFNWDFSIICCWFSSLSFTGTTRVNKIYWGHEFGFIGRLSCSGKRQSSNWLRLPLSRSKSSRVNVRRSKVKSMKSHSNKLGIEWRTGSAPERWDHCGLFYTSKVLSDIRKPKYLEKLKLKLDLNWNIHDTSSRMQQNLVDILKLQNVMQSENDKFLIRGFWGAEESIGSSAFFLWSWLKIWKQGLVLTSSALCLK